MLDILLMSMIILIVMLVAYFLIIRGIHLSQRKEDEKALREAIDKAVKELEEIKDITGGDGQDPI
jgi:large-conductance mechanosensitive channel